MLASHDEGSASIAAIVLSARQVGAHPRLDARRQMAAVRAANCDSVVGIVRGTKAANRAWWAAIVVTCVAWVFVGWTARHIEKPTATSPPRVMRAWLPRVLPEPKSRAIEARARAEDPVPAVTTPRRMRPARTRSPATPPDAAAHAPPRTSAPEPLDFTGSDLRAPGPAYVGGVVGGTGIAGEAGHASGSDPRGGTVAKQHAPDHSRGVMLPSKPWACAWPRTAETLGMREQSVMLRVTTTSTGKVTAVEIVHDPGYGFAAAAEACAKATMFEPALDRRGRPVAARSGPIRVRFTRTPD